MKITALLKRLWYGITRLLRIKPRVSKEKAREDAFRKKIQELYNLLHSVDKLLGTRGYSRHQRKQFWRDFFKYGEIRNDLFDGLIKTGDVTAKELK